MGERKEAINKILAELLGLTFNEQNHILANLSHALGQLNPWQQGQQFQIIIQALSQVMMTFSELWENRHRYKLTEPVLDFLKDDLTRAVEISKSIAHSRQI